MIRMTRGPTSPPPGPTTPMTTLTGHTKGNTASESQVSLNNFKKGTKRDASVFPIFKNDLYYDTFQICFLATIKGLGLCDVADPDLILMMKINIRSTSFLKNNLLCILSWLLLSKLKGRELVNEFE